MASKLPLLIYLHGFNSSPLSYKAQIMVKYCQKYRPDIRVIVPQLSCFPKDAADQIRELISSYLPDYRIGLIGSSLGGFFSIWANSQFHCRVVIVNPAVKPYELLTEYLGEQKNPYTKEHYVLKEQHIDELRALDIESVHSPSDFWLLQQKGDEVLDYRQAVSKFKKSRQTIENGGDHSFVHFERFASDIIDFFKY